MTCTRSVLIIIKAFSSLQPKIRYFKQLRNIYVFLKYKNENIIYIYHLYGLHTDGSKDWNPDSSGCLLSGRYQYYNFLEVLVYSCLLQYFILTLLSAHLMSVFYFREFYQMYCKLQLCVHQVWDTIKLYSHVHTFLNVFWD